MSSHLNNFPDTIICEASVAPQSISTTSVGAGVDLTSGDGACFVILCLGAIAGASVTITCSLEGSDDLANWIAVPDVTFPTLEEPATLSLSFIRTHRYTRAQLTVTGSSVQALVCVLIGQPRKLI